MTTIAIPEVTDAAVADFDGWDSAQLLDWLHQAVPAEYRLSTVMRTRIGLALWHLRRELPDDDYGREVDRLATSCNSTARSLRRWRLEAERKFGLPSPDARSEARSFMERQKAIRSADAPDRTGVATVATPTTESDGAEPETQAGTGLAPPAAPIHAPTQRGADLAGLVPLIVNAGATGWARACSVDQLDSMIGVLRAARRRLLEPDTSGCVHDDVTQIKGGALGVRYQCDDCGTILLSHPKRSA